VSLTRNELATRVRRMLYDFAMPASASRTAENSSTVSWILPDRYIDESSLRVFVTYNSVLSEVTGTAIYTFDPDSSTCTFDFTSISGTTTVPVGTRLDWTYTYSHWAEEDIVWALYDAISSLAPDLYCQASMDITSDGSYLYDLDDLSGEPVMRVKEVKLSQDGVRWERLSPQRHYRVERGELDAATLNIFSDVSDTTIRVSYARRPIPFSSGTESLADLGLPERVGRVLVLYATWTLLEQRIIPRMRSDIAVVTQGEGVPSPFMLLQHSARIKVLLDMELQRQRMRPSTAVGI